MHAQDIEYKLSLLGEQLEELGIRQTIDLLMIGGGFMLTQIGNRDFTKDIDVRVQNIAYRQYSDVYRIFRSAVRFVAYDTGADQGWLSDNIGDFLEIAGPVPRGTLWRRFGRWLRVYVPPKGYILAHKMGAGRDKDLGDIKALLDELHIITRKQAQRNFDRYIRNADIRKHSLFQEMLDRFFPLHTD